MSGRATGQLSGCVPIVVMRQCVRLLLVKELQKYASELPDWKGMTHQFLSMDDDGSAFHAFLMNGMPSHVVIPILNYVCKKLKYVLDDKRLRKRLRTKLETSLCSFEIEKLMNTNWYWDLLSESDHKDILQRHTKLKVLEKKVDTLGLALKVPSEFFCASNCTNIMSDPVVASDGYTYERRNLCLILQTTRKSAQTGENLDVGVMRCNRNLVASMHVWLENNVHIAESVSFFKGQGERYSIHEK